MIQAASMRKCQEPIVDRSVSLNFFVALFPFQQQSYNTATMFGIGYAGDELQKNCVPQEKYANKLDIEKLVWYNSHLGVTLSLLTIAEREAIYSEEPLLSFVS